MKKLKKLYYKHIKGIDLDAFHSKKGVWFRREGIGRTINFLEFEISSGINEKDLTRLLNSLTRIFGAGEVIGEYDSRKKKHMIRIGIKGYSEWQKEESTKSLLNLFREKKIFGIYPA